MKKQRKGSEKGKNNKRKKHYRTEEKAKILRRKKTEPKTTKTATKRQEITLCHNTQQRNEGAEQCHSYEGMKKKIRGAITNCINERKERWTEKVKIAFLKVLFVSVE